MNNIQEFKPTVAVGHFGRTYIDSNRRADAHTRHRRPRLQMGLRRRSRGVADRAHHDTLQGRHTTRKAVAPHRSMVVDILLCSHILYVLSRSGSIGLACIHPCRRLHPALHLNHDSACRKVIAQLKSNRENAKNRLKSAFWFQ